MKLGSALSSSREMSDDGAVTKNALQVWIETPPAIIFTGIAAALAFGRNPSPVPRFDVAFAVGYPLYLAVANRLRFNRNAPAIDAKRNVLYSLIREERGPWFKKYIMFFGPIGIFIPTAIQFVAPRSVADAAAPHLFLTLCQVVTETLHRGGGSYALIRLLVPIGFNAYRIRSLWIWTATAAAGFIGATDSNALYPLSPSVLWAAASLILASVNLVAWTYNLFVFLLLRVVPQYLDRSEFPPASVVWKGQLFPVVEKRE